MRYLAIEQIKENTVLAMPVYNDAGGILLNANTILKQSYLLKLSQMGYAGLYIYDEISNGIVVKNLIPEILKRKTVSALKTLNLDVCRSAAHSIVDELLTQSNISVDMVNIASFDNYTYIHCLNVAVLSVIVGIACNLNYDQLVLLSEAALLHDIGKLSINKEILNKKEPLTEGEMQLLRTHSQKGHDVLKENRSVSAVVKEAVLSHHENEDGSGYPRSLVSSQIPPFAKIIHVCDVYDALVSNRIYRKAMNPADALEYLMSNCWVMFDEKPVRKLIEYVVPYPTGITVELSDGQTAIVVRQNRISHARPVIKVMHSQEEIDLMKVLNLTIVKIIT